MSTNLAVDPDIVRRGLRREEYETLVRDGAFDRERIELLGGELVRMSPQSSEHRWIVVELAHLLTRLLGSEVRVAVQAPLAIGPDSEPEPDLAVTDPVDPDTIPTTAYLVVEVAATSLSFDLTHKAPRYAAAGVRQYWVVDVAAREVVVHTDPHGDHYRVVERVPRTTTLSVLDVSVPLVDVIPT